MTNLYRVETVRDFNGRNLRHVKFFETPHGCEMYIKECRSKGIEIRSSQHFRLVEDNWKLENKDLHNDN